MSNFAYMSGTGNNFLVGEYDGPVSEIQVSETRETREAASSRRETKRRLRTNG